MDTITNNTQSSQNTKSKMKSLLGGVEKKDTFDDLGRFGSDTKSSVDNILSSSDSLKKIAKQKAQDHEESPSLKFPSASSQDEKKPSLLQGIKFPPNIIISALLLLFIAFGGVAAFILGQQNQELRQQAASRGTPVVCSGQNESICTSPAYSPYCQWLPEYAPCLPSWNPTQCGQVDGCSYDFSLLECTGNYIYDGRCVLKTDQPSPSSSSSPSPSPSSSPPSNETTSCGMPCPNGNECGSGWTCDDTNKRCTNSSCSTADVDAIRIRGVVRDCNGDPVRGVEVQFHKDSGGNITDRATTDSGGVYKLEGSLGTKQFAIRTDPRNSQSYKGTGTSSRIGPARSDGRPDPTKCLAHWETCNPGKLDVSPNWWASENYTSGFDFVPTNCSDVVTSESLKCTISGPTTVEVGKSNNYSIGMYDAEDKFYYSQAFFGSTSMDPAKQVWTQIGGNISYSPQDVTRSWTCPAEGKYYVLCNARSTDERRCTGNPWCDGTISTCATWADCGENDRIEVTCTAPSTAKQCNDTCQTNSECQEVNTNYICSNNSCRHKDYPSQESCQALSAVTLSGKSQCSENSTKNATLSWTVPSQNYIADIAFFKIFRCGDTASTSNCKTPTQEITRVNKNSNLSYTFTDNTAFSNNIVTHKYRIRAFNAAGAAISAYSNVITLSAPRCVTDPTATPTTKPSNSPSPTPPAGQMCSSISFYPSATFSPQLGDKVKFQCNPTGLASQGYNYSFRVVDPKGSTTSLTKSTKDNPSLEYSINRSGEFTAQCLVCPNSATVGSCNWDVIEPACLGNEPECPGSCAAYCDATDARWKCTNCEAT